MLTRARGHGSTRWALAALACVSGLALGADRRAHADERDARVVARCGDATLTVGAVERRLATLSGPELAALGGTRAEAPKRLVEQVLAPELAAEAAARARGFERSPRVADRTRELLRQALERALQAETRRERPVTDADVAAYYEANRQRFEQPPRIRIWRLLVNDEAQAARLLAEAKQAGTPSKWSELVREHSIDKATHMRQGDLGFVRPDGSTDVPRVRVDAALFEAAKDVQDGEFVPRPVAEAGKFAVVWRRGSLPQTSRTLAEESASIRQLLERRRTDEARAALLARLRAEKVRGERPELLELVPEGVLAADRSPSARSELRAIPAQAGAAPPRATERGLR